VSGVRQAEAVALAIESKTRPYPIALVGPDHFRWRETGPADPRSIVDDPGVRLYCLDHAQRRAIFTVTPPDAPVVQAAFLYQAQYDAATGLVAVGYDTLHEIAAAVPLDVAKVLLIYSTGRCGSTLVSRLLDATPEVVSLSEPDVYTQIVALRHVGACDPAEAAALLATCTRIICAPRGGADVSVAVKFRSFATAIAEALHRELPGMRTAFLYRDARSWAASTMRAFGPQPEQTPEQAAAVQDRLGRLMPMIDAYRASVARTLTPVEAMACQWAGHLRDAAALLAAGLDVFMLRYADLVEAPQAALGALFAHAGLRPPPPARIAAVLAADSQAGNELSRDALDARVAAGADIGFDADALERVIAEVVPDLTGDTALPGTWTPRSATPA
jgi:hypothetical protein